MKTIKVKNLIEKHLLKKDYPSFWIINTLGWIIFITLDTLIISPDVLLKDWNRFVDNTVEWSSGIFITAGIRLLYRRIQYKTKSLLFVLGLILICSFIAALLLFVSSETIFMILKPVELQVDKYIGIISQLKYILFRLTQFFPIMTTWSLLYFGFKFWLDWSKEHDRAERLDLLAQSAQLQMLRYQVNPHFLFNSFSSLRALIRTNQEKAEEMVSKLSEFYRYSLTTKNNAEVPLIEEIEAIEHYFEIEKIRFGDKLGINISLDPLAEEYPVPCFLIHPLAENAIKYGMKTSALPLKIKIEARVKKNKLIICVMNSGKWLKQLDNLNVYSTNTGLANIKSRLEYSFPNNNKLDTKEEDGFVKVTIEIQKEIK